ncbi:MAG: HEAT repeat domain-containing protein [Planctomycetes bacterium]|nr:HEAT repeat domain-containing protein [Planctomycetota bacterium]
MRLLSFITAVLVIAQFQPCAQAQEKQPDTKITHIQGKTLEQWIKEIASPDPSKRENAIRTVLAFGPDRAYQAVPAILEHLDKHTVSAPIDASIRVNAAGALGVILGGVKDPDAKYVKKAVTLLKRLLEDSQSIVRYRAAQALGRIGAEAKDAIPLLIVATRDPQTWEVRKEAAVALGLIGREEKKAPPQGVIDALYKALGDKASQVRLGAVQAITWLGGPADKTYKAGMIKSLEPVALKDAEPTVQIWAHMAIMSISHEVSDSHLEAVCKFLQHQDVAARAQAAEALATAGAKAKKCVPALIETLSDPELTVVYWAIIALGRMESWGAVATPALERIRVDSKQSEAIRKAAQDAIEALTGKKIDKK